MTSYRTASTDRLLHAIRSMRSTEELYQLLEDVCTIKEIRDMAQRFDTAVLLSTGASYQAISSEIGISSATISRVNRCLAYGSGGYRVAIDRLKEQENNDD